MPAPTIVYDFYDENSAPTDVVARARCPGCEILAALDKDQYEGKVNIDCPECDYHETHDLRNE